ncbi:MAG: transcriptional regulator NrdR [Phycisphaerae bacterium]
MIALQSRRFDTQQLVVLSFLDKMFCPSCKSNSNKVIDSRLTEGGSIIRRRRVCLSCERRFTTKERVESELRLTVVKASGQRVPYSRDNILRGVERACSKLDITEDQLQQLVDRVEEDLFSNHDREVKTEQIGRYVGQHLRRLHPVAYVRFMSVYRKYSSVDEFIEEISDVRVRAAHEIPAQQSLFEA